MTQSQQTQAQPRSDEPAPAPAPGPRTSADPPGSWADRFDRIMPFGSSTSTKRARLEPEEPTVIVRGSGCRVWDDQDRELIDFRNALGPITLGYRHPVVDTAIRDQLEQGIVFG